MPGGLAGCRRGRWAGCGPRRLGSRHQLSEKLDGVLQFGGQGVANGLGLAGDFTAEGSDNAAATGVVAMGARQISIDDGGKRALRSLALGDALPEVAATVEGEADRFGRDDFLGAEL